MIKYGGYLFRGNPFHNGHKAVGMEVIRDFGPDNALFILGSANAPLSLRNPFSFMERKKFVMKLFPDVNVVGLNDFGNDMAWLDALDYLLKGNGIDPDDITFYGGCDEDIRFFLDAGKHCRIINRFDGKMTPKISATEVRDRLINSQSIDGLVDPLIIPDVQRLFAEKIEALKSLQLEIQA